MIIINGAERPCANINAYTQAGFQRMHTHLLEAALPDLDTEGLVAYLSTQADIVAAYLFGSQVKGRARAQSDIDLAVLLIEDMEKFARFEKRLELMAALSAFSRRNVDVVILNDAPPLLCHQALSEGRLVFERSASKRIQFEIRADKIYFDLKPLQAFFTEALLQEIRGGRFGERKQRHHRALAHAEK